MTSLLPTELVAAKSNEIYELRASRVVGGENKNRRRVGDRGIGRCGSELLLDFSEHRLESAPFGRSCNIFVVIMWNLEARSRAIVGRCCSSFICNNDSMFLSVVYTTLCGIDNEPSLRLSTYLTLSLDTGENFGCRRTEHPAAVVFAELQHEFEHS